MKDGQRKVTYECEICHRFWDVSVAATPTNWSAPRKHLFTPDTDRD